MKRVTKDGSVSVGDQQYILMQDKKRKGYYTSILQCIAEQLDAMLSYHSRVLVVRFDLHLYKQTLTNEPISRFMRKLLKRLKQTYRHQRIGYVWCREHNAHKSEAQHYHVVLLLDANKQRHPFNILKLIEEIWTNWGHPKPYTPKHCYYLLNRGDEKRYQAVFHRLSYLAKVYSKGRRPKATNDYSASRIKPKNQ